MQRVFLSGLAIILILIGAIAMFSPIPGAFLLLGIGAALLICTSDLAARCILGLRTRIRSLDRWMRWLEDRMGARIAGALRRTRPLY